jgi:hypothetical protein
MRNQKMFVIGRVVLWVTLIAWTGYGLWSGWRRTDELIALRGSGKRVNAQVIGCEVMPLGARMGYVHYAFNEGSRAIDNRLEVPVSMYSSFRIGQVVPVTYLPEEPHIVRIGNVDSGTVTRTAVVAVAFLISGLFAFGLPIIGISAFLGANKQVASSR